MLSLFATSLSFDLPKLRRKHPNRLPFRGVLTLIDVPSDSYPTGSGNHRVMIPRIAAESALPSLLGMALDYTPTLDAHDSRRKIGIITSAEIAPLSAISAVGHWPLAVDDPAFGPINNNVVPGALAQTYNVVPGALAQTYNVVPGALARNGGREAAPLRASTPPAAPGSVDPWLSARGAQRPVNKPILNPPAFSPSRGSALLVRGHIFARDFPEVVLALRLASSPGAQPSPTRSAWLSSSAAARSAQPSTITRAALGMDPSALAELKPSRVAATACSPPVHWRVGAATGASPVGTAALPPTNKVRAISASTDSTRIGPIRAHVSIDRFSQRPAATGQGPLGMSYEIAEVIIVNPSADIWVVRDFIFTGAAVLRRTHAAYRNTSIELLND